MCKGCEICIRFCPTEVFKASGRLNSRGYQVPLVAQEEACTACRLCELLCPDLAITITKPEEGKGTISGPRDSDGQEAME